MKPKYVKIDNKRYTINTDFRVALRCEKIAEDNSIGEYEKALAIIYLLFGDEGLNDKNNYAKLIELAQRYLLCDIKPINDNNEPDMNFEQDRGKIKASFFSDYGIQDIYSIDYMHWWDFFDYLNGLKEDCILNKTRELRTYDTSDIKDQKILSKIQKAQEMVSLKETKTRPFTEKELNSIEKFKKLSGQK